MVPRRLEYGLDFLGENLRKNSGSFSPKVRKYIQTYVFLEKNSFYSNCFSGYMDCTFANSITSVAPFCSPIILHSEFERFKFLISTKNLFPEMFHWTRKKPSWQTWNFFVLVKIFYKPSLLKVHHLPRNFFSKNGLLDTWISVLIIRMKLCATSPECFRSKKDKVLGVNFLDRTFHFPQSVFLDTCI